MSKHWIIWLWLAGALTLASGAPWGPATGGTKAAPADNRICVQCHRGYAEDYLAMRHAKGGAGCVKCHGDSAAHAADTSHQTPPQRMIARPSLNAFCLECHARETLTNDHDALLSGTSNKKLCTECHGQHLMAQRTRLWDKETGNLLPQSAVKKLNAARQKPAAKR